MCPSSFVLGHSPKDKGQRTKDKGPPQMSSANPAHDRGIPPEEPHGVSVPMPHHKVNYYAIFIALVALTVVTVAIAFKRFDNEMVNVLLALLVASIKAMFVAMYFMHLK